MSQGRARPRRAALLALIVSLAACSRAQKTPPEGAAASSAAAATSVAPAVSAASPAGDLARGKVLVEQFECNRCHYTALDREGPLKVRPDWERACTNCHQWLEHGARLGDDSAVLPAQVAAWRKSSDKLKDIPPLTRSAWYKQAWIERFLLEPYDVRPNLVPMMPRLAITADQARDIAAWITSLRPAPDGGAALDGDALAGADLAEGRRLIEDQACGTCHLFTGVPPLPQAPSDAAAKEPGVVVAPDLRFTRDRLDADALLAWLDHPDDIVDHSLMPRAALSKTQARHVAAYLLRAELAPLAKVPIPARLPLLDRKVGYDEVARKVLHRICRHCHGEPDFALGEGGPGNTGGFGFKARGLSLVEYEAVAAGSLDDHGDPRSIFAPMSDGTPRLVRALLARQREEAGTPDPEIRGMPLGLPSLPPEDIQLVESWVAQQHPR